MKKRKMKNAEVRKMKSAKYNLKCKPNCPTHDCPTHNTCLVCRALKTSPYHNFKTTRSIRKMIDEVFGNGGIF